MNSLSVEKMLMQPYYSIVLPTFNILFMLYIYNGLIIFILCFEGIFGCEIQKGVN
jgi:hypothetical protein